ncbi:MAG TPA: D-aminoacylase [Gemmatimonadaceae bacterium]|nr:D-aminoacylase [Gemmatimonadaceae bacterium]
MRLFVLAPALALVACTRPSSAPAPAYPDSYELVIAGGKIVDGTGNPWFYGDVGIVGDRIARIAPAGMLARVPARRRIDARGLVVAPGAIDIQAHSEEQLLAGDSRVVSMITQGVTTAIMGEGDTPGQVSATMLAEYLGSGGDTSLAPLLRTFVGPNGFGEWLRAMERHTASVNIGSFLGAGGVRQYAKNMAEGAPTPAELDTMRVVVRQAMRDGAFGIGSALIYPPGNYASTEELIELAKAMAPYGGVYITHMRSEGDRLVEAVDEALRIGRDGGVPVEIYHLKAAGVKNWPKMKTVIAKLDSARAAGQDVTVDQYPYTAGSNNLSSCIPPWAHADGKLLDRLRDGTTRARIKAEMTDENANFESLCLGATPQGVQVLGFTVDSLKKYEGKRLPEIAAAWNKDWADALMDLTLAERNRLGQVIFIASDSNIATQVKLPYMKFGTDAAGYDPDSISLAVHPRSYGTYPRILGRYVREYKWLTLEDAVRKMSGATAARLSIRDRGELKEGWYADIMVFDPNTIIDRATYERPHQLSEGVIHVLVNGVPVVTDGKVTGAKPGRIVRGPAYGLP